jgi:hypothetical protein
MTPPRSLMKENAIHLCSIYNEYVTMLLLLQPSQCIKEMHVTPLLGRVSLSNCVLLQRRNRPVREEFTTVQRGPETVLNSLKLFDYSMSRKGIALFCWREVYYYSGRYGIMRGKRAEEEKSP